MPTYLAKSEYQNGKPVTVTQHCVQVATMAQRFAKSLGLSTAAFLVGLFHDFGKYSPAFQAVLSGNITGIDHALPGAAVLSSQNCPGPLIEATAGHHGGLRPYAELTGHITAIQTNNQPHQGPYQKYSSLNGRMELACALQQFSQELAEFKFTQPTGNIWPDWNDQTWPDWKRQLLDMFLTRMLFSCQIDADYTTSAGETPVEPSLDIRQAKTRLMSRHSGLKANSTATPDTNHIRETVYKFCGLSGTRNSYHFQTLTAPTGSGKTMGMMNFALNRMAADPTKNRVIFILPFLTLIDQSLDAIQSVFPDVTVDSSVFNAETETDRRLTETWAGPCIVTTTVQFFNSLFSDNPGDCRKLHNLADAIIIFDEIQALPLFISRVAIQTLAWLTEHFNTDILLSTATQPEYKLLAGLTLPDIKEIIPDPKALFQAMPKRTLYWQRQPLELSNIAVRSSRLPNACVVTNLRRHALEIFQSWQAAGTQNCYLLTSDLCPAHRRDIVQKIKQHQAAEEPVHVSATQCIEAGVDLDFEYLYRAIAPITSVLQAAGRQNRNGRYPGGHFTIFEPVMQPGNQNYPGEDYARQAAITKAMLANGYDIFDPTAISIYYQTLQTKDPEPEALTDALESRDYPAVAKLSRLIKNNGVRVIVPYGNDSTYQTVLDAALSGHVTKRMIATAGGISVSCYDMANVQTHCQELMLGYGDKAKHSGVYILLPGHENCYSPDIGLSFANSTDTFML